jgi:RNA polymerase sigma-70 factor, ECF subfamily
VLKDPDADIVARLRAGDEGAFIELAEKYHAAMLSIAVGYVPSRAVAEEVVQEAWVGMLRGISGFGQRSLFRTWLFRILVNRAISAGVRERRTVPMDDLEPVVEASRFDAYGNWLVPPEPWADKVDDRLIAAKMAARILTAIDDLPARQREVVTLRDVQGLSSDEVCAVLDISPANQRVLLHRGRGKLRQLIESEFGRTRCLPREKRRRFEAHLARCPNCPEYLAQMRALMVLAGIITPDNLTPHARRDFIHLYRQWQADEAHGA